MTAADILALLAGVGVGAAIVVLRSEGWARRGLRKRQRTALAEVARSVVDSPAPHVRAAHVRDLAESWGRDVYERQYDGPRWAARILEAAERIDPDLPEVRTVIEVASDPATRRLAPEAFYAARRRSLAEQPAEGVETIRNWLLTLAELVAKAAYNDTRPHNPFDEDAPWYIATTAIALGCEVKRRLAGGLGSDYEMRVRLAVGAPLAIQL
jgi:hypothetical protein